MKQAFSLIAILFALSVVFSVPAAFAQDGAEPTPIPIKEAWDLPNKTPVAVEGYIIKSLGPEKYILAKDGVEIRVKIDSDAWGGDPTGEKDLIIVYGEMYKHGNAKEIEVTKVERK